MTASSSAPFGSTHADSLSVSTVVYTSDHCDRSPPAIGNVSSSGKSSSVDQIKLRLKRHRDDIKNWLNVAELLPHLCQHRLVQSDKARRRFVSLHFRGKRSKIFTLLSKTLSCTSAAGRGCGGGQDAYARFLQCLREEREHLGHHHIANLLEGTKCDVHDVNISRLTQQGIMNMGPMLSSYLSIKELLPSLRQNKLLTLSELELLHEDSALENNLKVQTLLTILETKGPTAHLIFFHCLEREKSHRGHEDIYRELCRQVDESLTLFSERETLTRSSDEDNEQELSLDVVELVAVCEPHCRTPCRLGLEGSLAGEEHIYEMRQLQQHRYHGRWDCFRQGIDDLTMSSDINVTAVGKLHYAVASIMSGNTNLSLQLVNEVEKMCSTLYGNNNQILLGRCLYIRSAVHRHLQDYDSARRYLDLSKQKLANSEPGADTASLYYHEGTLQLDLLQQQSGSSSCSRRQREKAEKSFRMAVEHAEHGQSGLPLIAWHSKVFLALLYLGSSHDSVSQELPSITDLDRAESILSTLDCGHLPPRTLALYHIAYSDIYRWKGDLAQARHNATLGLTKAEQGNFAFEKKFAFHRLQSLQCH